MTEAEAVEKMMSGWQPIDTAPKDGAVVLLTDGYSLAAARWDNNSWPHAEARWSITDWHNDPIHLRGGYRATHWMKLPESPK